MTDDEDDSDRTITGRPEDPLRPEPRPEEHFLICSNGQVPKRVLLMLALGRQRRAI